VRAVERARRMISFFRSFAVAEDVFEEPAFQKEQCGFVTRVTSDSRFRVEQREGLGEHPRADQESARRADRRHVVRRAFDCCLIMLKGAASIVECGLTSSSHLEVQTRCATNVGLALELALAFLQPRARTTGAIGLRHGRFAWPAFFGCRR